MRFDRLRYSAWMAPVLTAALVASLSGSDGSRALAASGLAQPRIAVRTPTAAATLQGQTSHPDDDDDPGPGGGGPFQVGCPMLMAPSTWSTRLLGTPFMDFASDAATDDAICAIFETGYTFGSLAGWAGASDGYLARYSTTGALVWVQQLGTAGIDSFNAVAVDSQHNVYVAGATAGTMPGSPTPNQGGGDAVLAKYDQNGTLLWIRQLGSAANDVASGIAIDANDQVYITGGTEGQLPGAPANQGGWDYFLARYDGNGTLLMVTSNGSSAADHGHAVTVGPAGNVYVAGETWGALGAIVYGQQDIFIARHDPTGAMIWIDQRGTPQNDAAYGVAANDDNQVFAAGTTAGNLDNNVNQGGRDIFVLRYDANGTWVWTDQRGTDLDDVGSDVDVRSSGGPYTTGWTQGPLDGNVHVGSDDLFVMKHGKAGAWFWTRQMGTTAADFAQGVAVDGWDNAYSVGSTMGNLGGKPNAGSLDAFAVKYNISGGIR